MGEVYRLKKSADNYTFSIDRYNSDFVNGGSVWRSLFSISYSNAAAIGTCIIPHNLSVGGNSEFLKTVSIKTPSQGGGNFRIEPAADGNESSIGYYNRSDLRASVAGDMWVCGVNSWGKTGYCMGTSVLGSCLNIYNSGTVEMPYSIKTSEIKVLNTNGTLYIRNSLGATIAEFYDDKSAFIFGDLVVGGSITATNSNPFYIAGKVAANGSKISSKGRIGFSVAKTGTGGYAITPDTAFGNTNYIVSVTSQVDTDTGYSRLNSSVMTVSSFAVATSIGTVRADSIFHFIVLN